jgi:hypothetical protein
MQRKRRLPRKEDMTTISAAPTRRSTGRLFLALGLGVAALGVIGCVVQFSMRDLKEPKYLPISGTLAVALLLVSLWQKRTVWRVLALLLVLLLAGAEWAVLLSSRLPPYTGPVAVGQSFPAFTTMRADGKPFTQDDLEGEQDTVLVFFRGRW